MAEVVLHLVRDDTVFDIDETELEDIDEALSSIDDTAVDMAEIEPLEPEEAEVVSALAVDDEAADEQDGEIENAKGGGRRVRHKLSSLA
jgi:hypothetical protein